MSRLRHTLLLVVVGSAVLISVEAEEPCSPFQPEAGCSAKGGTVLRVSFGQAELSATPWVRVPIQRHGQGPHVLFRPSQLPTTTPPKTADPIDCRMLQPADPLVDHRMVRRAHGGVAHTARVVTVAPCPVNRHR